MQMAQQDELEWFKGELLRVEQNIQEVEASIIAAIRAKEDSAVITRSQHHLWCFKEEKGSAGSGKA
jgi:hypothetical protein